MQKSSRRNKHIAAITPMSAKDSVEDYLEGLEKQLVELEVHADE